MYTKLVNLPKKKERRLLPHSLNFESWDSLKPYFDALLHFPINTIDELKQWLQDEDELCSVLSEHGAWLYINMNCDTNNETFWEAYDHYYENIEPNFKPYYHNFNKKLIASPLVTELGTDYKVVLRSIKNEIELFRKENIPLFSKLQIDEQKYGNITSKMMVEVDGKELTLQQASVFLKSLDRVKRKEVYHKIINEKVKGYDELNTLFSLMLKNRHRVAVNAGFNNFRDYEFSALNRFDYTKEDCFAFHDVVRAEVLPIISSIDENRRKKLKLDTLKPWDTEVDSDQLPPLHPVSSSEELIEKSVKCFNKILPYFGECLEVMKKMKRLDLDSRKGKAPGGFNFPLSETLVPFIYMNSAGTLRDVVTMMHEGGHAIHSFLCKDLPLDELKNTSSEVAELASMSMELISMEHWDVFFKDENELKRAKREQLEKIIKTFPSVMTVDKFQHWIYENPKHSGAERELKWNEITSEFSAKVVDWSEQENVKGKLWQSYLHIFEVPFYYIEYAMAQLGAIAVWRNYKKNPTLALNNYIAALKLGNTRTIPEIYKTAGIEFNFSRAYVKELTHFVNDELNKL